MLTILQNTPIRVYLIFLLVVCFGIKAFSPRRESRASMLITPPAFLAWSLYTLNLTINPALFFSIWLGALLLGVYDDGGRLQYIGHTGAGFSDAELGRVWKKLQALKTKGCPFKTTPRTNERPHWVKPELVAEVKFTEWTADNRLRHPTYLGLRDDVKPETVRREPDPRLPESAPVRRAKSSASPPAKSSITPPASTMQ